MWPTSQATLAPSPPLLSLRTDTIWPQVSTTDGTFTLFWLIFDVQVFIRLQCCRNIGGKTLHTSHY